MICIMHLLAEGIFCLSLLHFLPRSSTICVSSSATYKERMVVETDAPYLPVEGAVLRYQNGP